VQAWLLILAQAAVPARQGPRVSEGDEGVAAAAGVAWHALDAFGRFFAHRAGAGPVLRLVACTSTPRQKGPQSLRPDATRFLALRGASLAQGCGSDGSGQRYCPPLGACRVTQFAGSQGRLLRWWCPVSWENILVLALKRGLACAPVLTASRAAKRCFPGTGWKVAGTIPFHAVCREGHSAVLDLHLI